jgi:predicted short-subunit dehydrogenase-like oxidoreductase (DUF2520 family)
MSDGDSGNLDLVIIGPGRLGASIAPAAEAAGLPVRLIGRDVPPEGLGGQIVLLSVPDAAIATVAAGIAASGERPRMIGHTSGAGPLSSLDAARASEGEFLLHPLQTFPEPGTNLAGVPIAVWGTTEAAREVAEGLATTIGGSPFPVPEEIRAAYHAAASMASNFLVTLEESASELLERAGVPDARRTLAPLVRTTLENWVERGGLALTGPIVRGDENTVEAHRAALAELDPELIELYDVLADRTRALSARIREQDSRSGDDSGS